MDAGFLVIRASNYFVMDFIERFNHFIVSVDNVSFATLKVGNPV